MYCHWPACRLDSEGGLAADGSRPQPGCESTNPCDGTTSTVASITDMNFSRAIFFLDQIFCVEIWYDFVCGSWSHLQTMQVHAWQLTYFNIPLKQLGLSYFVASSPK